MVRIMAKFNRNEYMREYVKRYKVIKLNFNEENDRDMLIYLWLTLKDNKTEYIKALVENDMKKQGAI